MNYTSICPHCNATLYGSMISKCGHCGNAVDVRVKTEQAYLDKREAARLKKEQGFFYRFWMNTRYARFRKACMAGRGHLVEAEVSGKSNEMVGNRARSILFKHMHLTVTKMTDGPAAWDGFWKPRLYGVPRLCVLECPGCRHAYAILAQCPPLSDPYLASCKSGWFQIYSDAFSPTHGKFRLACPNCGQRTPKE